MADLHLFDKRGKFMPLDAATIDAMSPERQRLYQAVADAAADLERADAELAAATDAVRSCADAVREAEKQMPRGPTFHELWRQTFGRPRSAPGEEHSRPR